MHGLWPPLGGASTMPRWQIGGEVFSVPFGDYVIYWVGLIVIGIGAFVVAVFGAIKARIQRRRD